VLIPTKVGTSCDNGIQIQVKAESPKLKATIIRLSKNGLTYCNSMLFFSKNDIISRNSISYYRKNEFNFVHANWIELNALVIELKSLVIELNVLVIELNEPPIELQTLSFKFKRRLI